MSQLSIFNAQEMVVREDGSQYLSGDKVAVPVEKSLKKFENIETPIINIPDHIRQTLGLHIGERAEIQGKGWKMELQVQPSKRGDGNFIRLNEAARLVLDVGVGDTVLLPTREKVILCLDISGSLLDYMGSETKIEATKKAACDFIQQKVGTKEKVGLVIFNHKAKELSLPINDYNRLIRLIKEINAGGGTEMDKGMLLAYNLLSGSGLKRVIVLADGLSDPNRALLAAQEALHKEIVVDTIGAGYSYDLDVSVLKKIAEVTGGVYRHVSDPAQMREEFVDLSTEKKISLALVQGKRNV